MASPTGTEVVTGSGINNDVLNWLNSLGDFTNTQRGQDINYDLGMRGQDLDYISMLMQFYQNGQAAEQAYQSDIRQYGLQVAQFNYQQRLGKAQIELEDKARGLQQAQAQTGVDALNFQQRSDVAGKKLSIIDMLAKRSGPQDWVGYNSVLNQLSPPGPTGTAKIDPFQVLEGLYKEATLAIPAWAQGPTNTSGLDQQFAPAYGAGPSALMPPAPPAGFGRMPGTGYGGGGGGIFSNLLAGRGQGQANGLSRPVLPSVDMGAYSGIPLSSVNSPNRAGAWWNGTTGSGGPSMAQDYFNNGFDVFGGAGQITDPNAQIDPNTPIWLRRRAMGGVSSPGTPVLVGDQPSGKPTGNEEVASVINPGPDTKLIVMPVNSKGRKAAAKQGRGSESAVVMLGRELIRRAATGGVYGTSATDPFYTFNRYSPADLGNQPFMRKLFGLDPAYQFTGHAGSLQNPMLGLYDVPSLLNLQAYRDLYPTEKAATADMYQQGLGVDMGDILERSRRAAPFGQSNGPSRYGS